MAKSCLRMNPFKQRKHINVIINNGNIHKNETCQENNYDYYVFVYSKHIYHKHFKNTFSYNTRHHEHGHIKGSSIKLKWGFKT